MEVAAAASQARPEGGAGATGAAAAVVGVVEGVAAAGLVLARW